MKNKIIITITVLLFSIKIIYSQSTVDGYKTIPEERVFIHHNTSFLFTGEYLYYKVYCLNAKTKILSDLSKIAYVELINEKKEIVFKHKIKLKNGLGQGDFFLPVSLSSGNYKLIGYTQWMKNFGVSNFFLGDLAILNPYQGNQKTILADSISLLKTSTPSKIDVTTPAVSIITNKKIFGKREKVQVSLKGINEMLPKGNYSFSVRKLDTIKTPDIPTITSFHKKLKTVNTLIDQDSKSIALPELRGELICGKITGKDSGFNVENQKITFSIPGKNYEVKIATTDIDGNFCFNLNNEYVENKGYIEVLSDNDKYIIELKPQTPNVYKDLKFNQFKITKEMKDLIVKRSVYNQIRNRYFSVKPDTLSPVEETLPFYGNGAEVYNLDDYTRFPTLQETLVEVVNNVWIKKIENDKYIFQVRYKYPPYNEPEHLPLVIIDGLIIKDHTVLIDLDARKVKSISVSRDKHYLGAQIFQGIVDIKTKKGDYYKTINKNGINEIALFKPLPLKKYFVQQYNSEKKKESKRIPDFRNQLIWLPNVSLDKRSSIITFFTSNNTGQFELILEGYSDKGVPVFAREIIAVK
ncbi:hypothetical protein [Aquimarina sp. 2201CG5-10]|uniref:hypothetical protein n=1 Tax=Aquimarina callyspongiae TaxID=3098150 RepID=UPI002AB4509A|nr:hypothetical protein [Aquimarina sp. 2201CG5-10]MDY8138138.1 hypothetical protein [Aquimarina sp. 2201CG5-10]